MLPLEAPKRRKIDRPEFFDDAWDSSNRRSERKESSKAVAELEEEEEEEGEEEVGGKEDYKGSKRSRSEDSCSEAAQKRPPTLDGDGTRKGSRTAPPDQPVIRRLKRDDNTRSSKHHSSLIEANRSTRRGDGSSDHPPGHYDRRADRDPKHGSNEKGENTKEANKQDTEVEIPSSRKVSLLQCRESRWDDLAAPNKSSRHGRNKDGSSVPFEPKKKDTENLDPRSRESKQQLSREEAKARDRLYEGHLDGLDAEEKDSRQKANMERSKENRESRESRQQLTREEVKTRDRFHDGHLDGPETEEKESRRSRESKQQLTREEVKAWDRSNEGHPDGRDTEDRDSRQKIYMERSRESKQQLTREEVKARDRSNEGHLDGRDTEEKDSRQKVNMERSRDVKPQLTREEVKTRDRLNEGYPDGQDAEDKDSRQKVNPERSREIRQQLTRDEVKVRDRLSEGYPDGQDAEEKDSRQKGNMERSRESRQQLTREEVKIRDRLSEGCPDGLDAEEKDSRQKANMERSRESRQQLTREEVKARDRANEGHLDGRDTEEKDSRQKVNMERSRESKQQLTREEAKARDRSNEGHLDGHDTEDKDSRQKVNTERLEDGRRVPESRGRSSLKMQDDDESLEGRGRVKDEEEDRRMSGGGRFNRAVKRSRSPEGRRSRGNHEEYGRERSDDRKDFERERGFSRDHGREQENYIDTQRERGREGEASREKESVRERDFDMGKDRGRTRDREDTERWVNRQREKQKDGDKDALYERGSREVSSREGERMDRDWNQRNMDDRDRREKGRVDVPWSPQSSVAGDAAEQGSGNLYGMDPNRERGFAAGPPSLFRRGQTGGFSGDFNPGSNNREWACGPDERSPPGDAFMSNDNRERYPFEEEGPPGLDQNYGPSSSWACSDNGMAFSMHDGRGRGSKGSPGQRGRGGQFNDGRPAFAGYQGGGPMARGIQQGGKGGRGRVGVGVGVGGGARGRGGPRDVQRGGGMPMPLMGPGPGLGPGMPPHFGPMGPGSFPVPPFGGSLGWGGGPGTGEMIMMPPVSSVPTPSFGPIMGPGPNPFFNPPGPSRGGPNSMPGFPIGGLPGGVSNIAPEKSAAIRLTPRINAPHGRAPSRGEQNDYSQHFVDTGLRPQNFIRDVDLNDRFEEYPKLKELITRKDKLIEEKACPPMYMQLDLRTTELTPEMFGIKFDVILVDPPWEEYVRRAPGVGDSMEWWAFEEIMNLRIEAIADNPSFIFLWVGDAEGLDQGRMCLKKWGFRRCEDICWVKTNKENPTPSLRHDSSTVLQHSKEHCLMGIKGTVRRSTDGHIIHANIDTDIIISEEPSYGSTTKPEELYRIIEHFSLGQRRLELFGEDHNIRAGWVTVGKSLSSSNFNAQAYLKQFTEGEGKLWQGGRGNPPADASHLLGTTPEIEALRPKSPPPRGGGGGPLPLQATPQKVTTVPQNGQQGPLLPTPAASTPNCPAIIVASSPQDTGKGPQGGGTTSNVDNTEVAAPEDNIGIISTTASNLQGGFSDAETHKEASLYNPFF